MPLPYSQAFARTCPEPAEGKGRAFHCKSSRHAQAITAVGFPLQSLMRIEYSCIVFLRENIYFSHDFLPARSRLIN
jgi:hypothetical protein